MDISEEILIYFRIARSHKGKFNSVGILFVFFVFLVLFVAVLWFVFSSAVAHKCVFLGPLPMFLEHQHPLVVGVGRSSREEESNTFTFGLGLLHLLLGQTLATPEPSVLCPMFVRFVLIPLRVRLLTFCWCHLLCGNFK